MSEFVLQALDEQPDMSGAERWVTTSLPLDGEQIVNVIYYVLSLPQAKRRLRVAIADD